MSKADKRERQRQNRELAKLERERLIKRDRRLRSARGLLFVLVPVVVLFVIYNLVKSNPQSKTENGCVRVTSSNVPKKNTKQKAPAQTIDPAKTYTARMVTSCGTMTLALDAKTAPVATNNFVSLARSGFYNGVPFDRVAKDFVIQGGGSDGKGAGDIGYSVKGEVPTDHYPVGSLAAAKTSAAPAGDFGSAFFIMTGPSGAQLPNDYARFGNVTKGLGVAKKIATFAPASGDGAPTQTVLVNKVTITES